MADLRAPGKQDKSIALVTGNATETKLYRDVLDKLIARMAASYVYWLRGKYEQAVSANQDAGRIPDPETDFAMDAGPKGDADKLYGELKRLRDYWTSYFDKLALDIAQNAVSRWYRANTRSWDSNVKRAGFDIKMQLSASQQVILRAKITENVSLIKSLPENFITQTEGSVLRAFTAGRDIAPLADEIKQHADVSTRRAALIARDQVNKASAQMNDARQRELGLQFAYWVHSSAGKEPRLKHVTAGREQWVYVVGKGIDFNDGFGPVLPGQAINCRCSCRTIIPAIGRGDVVSMDDLEPVPGYAGAYRARKGKTAGERSKMDVEKTRSPKGSPVKYS